MSIRMDDWTDGQRTDGQRTNDEMDGWKGRPPKDIIDLDNSLRDFGP